MTVPEENQPKAKGAEDAAGQPAEPQRARPRATGSPEGRTLGEAMEEAGITPEDYEDR